MFANLKKTYYFCKRNGMIPTFFAVIERLQEKKNNSYTYVSPKKEVLEEQRKAGNELDQNAPLISILVPAYKTPEPYIRAMVESVLEQTYPIWELVIMDASENAEVKKIVDQYPDKRIKCYQLPANGGISENTKAGLKYVTGAYTALLDHDDVITPDALYEMYQQISEDTVFIYSDEDKCNADETIFFDYHQKNDFNLDLLLTNNYICHFSMIETALLKEVSFRKEFDGAQDFDLFIRVVESAAKQKKSIKHIPKVLYHWRSHELSTAANPQSKLYAYEAGKKAISQYYVRQEISAIVKETPHVGFYRTEYQGGIFSQRKDVGAVVRKRTRWGRIQNCVYDADANAKWYGMFRYFSGYMHGASMQQDVYAGDVRSMYYRKELAEVIKALCEHTEFTVSKCILSKGQLQNLEGNVYQVVVRPGTKKPSENRYKEISLKISELIRSKGYVIFYEPR